ncbi:ChaN family lipoprotein [Amaricoccus macauensis]|uniref:ChaN family lipoprotein n=1 Tax=Amaricoccus macauensis TaxID=57001 RepID=UPI003C7A446C
MSWIDPGSGEGLTHPQAVACMANCRAVLLGEQHDRAEDHRFQELSIAGLAAQVEGLQIGFEMFPRHLQPVLDVWVEGQMSEAGFLREVGWEKVWGFPPELYLPLFRICRDLSLPMIAMNVERPVVSIIGREGWEALPEEYRSWMTPAVPATPAYRRYLFEVTGGVRPGRKAQSPEDPAFDNFVRAQQVWDRAFACAIAHALEQDGAGCVAGIIGRGHLEYHLGVYAQLTSLGIEKVAVALPHRESSGEGKIADLVFASGGKAHLRTSPTHL